MDEITKFIDYARSKNLYPEIRMVSGFSTKPEVVVDGRKVFLFCSSNYLGIACDDRVQEAVIEGTRKYGLGACGSRLISGTLDVHRDLEKRIARFKNAEDAITFPTGYMANVGTISAVLDVPPLTASTLVKKGLGFGKTVIFSDELNHASIIDGCRLSKARKVIYKHADMNDLESKLSRFKRYGSRLIISDGVFSMDGDITPLPQLVKLAEQYKAMLMIDDAHATGVLGRNGGGTVEHFQMENKVDILMGTFSKAFGAIGGFVVGNKDLVDYLRVTARSYIFSGALPGAVAAGIIRSIQIAENEKERRERLKKNAEYLRKSLQALGFNTLGSSTQIIPVLIGEETKAIKIADELFQKGIFAPCLRWPAVPKNESRLRFSLMATHSTEHLNFLLNVLEDLGKNFKIIS